MSDERSAVGVVPGKKRSNKGCTFAQKQDTARDSWSSAALQRCGLAIRTGRILPARRSGARFWILAARERAAPSRRRNPVKTVRTMPEEKDARRLTPKKRVRLSDQVGVAEGASNLRDAPRIRQRTK